MRPSSPQCLGAPDDVRSLLQALADREQQLLELRRRLEERGDELMIQLNTPPT
ncbi:hypothetical protein ACGFIF_31310 [Kribbella sp. NPDC049174]|uniref:hypothetical protein n=1 Tax=Kribbella sp. NPDC049174 TaxID=3364112 RepID=UPI003710F628